MRTCTSCSTIAATARCHAFAASSTRCLPTNALLIVFAGVTLFTPATGFSPTATNVLDLVLSETPAFLGVLFCLSAFASSQLLPAREHESPLRTVALPLAGAVALAFVVGIEIGRLVLHPPFAAWRGLRSAAYAAADAYAG